MNEAEYTHATAVLYLLSRAKETVVGNYSPLQFQDGRLLIGALSCGSSLFTLSSKVTHGGANQIIAWLHSHRTALGGGFRPSIKFATVNITYKLSLLSRLSQVFTCVACCICRPTLSNSWVIPCLVKRYRLIISSSVSVCNGFRLSLNRRSLLKALLASWSAKSISAMIKNGQRTACIVSQNLLSHRFNS